jgi:hypothetical protein
MMLLTGHSGIDLNASVNELPCFRKLRIELTENGTFQAVGSSDWRGLGCSCWLKRLGIKVTLGGRHEHCSQDAKRGH